MFCRATATRQMQLLWWGFAQLRQEKAQMLYSVEQVMQQKMEAHQQQQAENAAATEGGSAAS